MAEQNLNNGGFSILDVDEQFPSARVRQTAMYQEQHEKFMALDERYRKDFLKSVEDGNCPFLPDESEAGQLIDTTIPVKLGTTGPTTMKDTLLIMAKVKQAELGAPTPEFVTNEMIEGAMKAGVDTGVLEAERAKGLTTIMAVREDPKNEKSKVIDYKNVVYYNLSQVKNPEMLRDYIAARYQKSREERAEFLKGKYGDNAYEFKDKEYPKFREPDEKTAILCDGQNAAEIVGQAIVAGLNGKRMRMYKGEAEILKTELTKMLNTKHKRVVAEFGKAVGKEVRKYTRAMKIEAGQKSREAKNIPSMEKKEPEMGLGM